MNYIDLVLRSKALRHICPKHTLTHCSRPTQTFTTVCLSFDSPNRMYIVCTDVARVSLPQWDRCRRGYLSSLSVCQVMFSCVLLCLLYSLLAESTTGEVIYSGSFQGSRLISHLFREVFSWSFSLFLWSHLNDDLAGASYSGCQWWLTGILTTWQSQLS